jgi:hypothetical protein
MHAVGASALLRSLDAKDLGYGAQLEYRLRWPSEYQLGLAGAALANYAGPSLALGVQLTTPARHPR